MFNRAEQAVSRERAAQVTEVSLIARRAGRVTRTCCAGG